MIGSGMRILLIDLILLTSVCLTWGGFASLLPLPQNFSVNSFYINWLHMGQDWPGMNYTVVKVGDKGMGGIMSIPKEAQGTPPMWVAYVTVDDVDLTARTAEQLGARLCVPPRDIPNVGRFACFKTRKVP